MTREEAINYIKTWYDFNTEYSARSQQLIVFIDHNKAYFIYDEDEIMKWDYDDLRAHLEDDLFTYNMRRFKNG